MDEKEKSPPPVDSKKGNDKFLVVGIGASAGGIQALQEFFRNVPADSGCAYVVILHLSPDHDSKLVELLRTVASIPVSSVSGRTKVKPNQVYVISPNKHLEMVDGDIDVSENLTLETRRAPVDIFFRTLAESHGPRAVCVVLSGTGANGSMGLKRIKEKGGAALVQSPEEAEFNEMPSNSIDTEIVDEILPVRQIPARIVDYGKSLGVAKISDEPEHKHVDQQQVLRDIFLQLRQRTGHDFSNYKRPTVLRRIERRINVKNLPDLSTYSSYLQKNPDEIAALQKDLLISVTNFFRDPGPFKLLETEVLPTVIQRTNDEGKIRIWVAGCATGEEAYSIAMLCIEQSSGLVEGPKIQIFATDIDDSAIAIAREGFYTLNDAADVSPDRLRRFFTKENEGYRIRREIREMVLFATHNFLKDPPFSRLNLVTCRNSLIYLNHQAQERVMNTFHFALNPGGFLFLGTSESIDGAHDLYSMFSREGHIFQSRPVSGKHYPVPESIPNFRISQYAHSTKVEEKETRASGRITFGDLHQRLLEQYSPPSVVVNEEYEIVHMSDKAGHYFEFSGGQPTQNILRIIRPEMRLELRSALYKAVQKQTAVDTRALQVQFNGGIQSVVIRVRPGLSTDNTATGFLLIIFEAKTDEDGSREIKSPLDDSMAKQLEDELIQLKAHLRNSNERHELQSEELKASNEELQAINEELRSAAEELETSKEELHSINEELRTVNQELKVKIEESNQATNNLQNLINSADVGTIFLDRSLQVKLFTPTVSEIFNLRSSDCGRPITDITNKIDYHGMVHDAETVLKKLNTVEREVTATNNHYYLMRLLPYRTHEDKIDGVVITFFDITKNKQIENALHESQEKFRTLTDVVPQLVWANDPAGTPNYFNKRWYEFSGLSVDQSVGLGWQAIVHPAEEKVAKEKWVEALATGRAFEVELRLRNASGIYSWHLCRNVPLRDSRRKILGWFGSATDIQKMKEAEEIRRSVADRLQLSLEAGLMGSYEYDFNTGLVESSPQHKANFGFTDSEVVTFENLKSIVVPEDHNLIETEVAKKTPPDKIYSTEYRIRRNDNSIRWIKSVGRVLYDEKNVPTRMVGITVDVTELKAFTAELGNLVSQRTLELQQSNEDLIQFAHVASHDLKEPVRKIKTFAGRLMDEFGASLPEGGKEYLSKIQKATARMQAMIEGVLSYSLHGILDESFAQVDLSQIIRQIESDLELVISQKRAVIKKSELPTIRANPILTHQLFFNLLSNSLKFAKKEMSPIITITHAFIQRDGENYLKIELSDNGIGFENEFENKIFEPFLRLNSKDLFEGTGLGLALCKKIVERHRGFIFARGIPDKGAIFTVLLPA